MSNTELRRQLATLPIAVAAELLGRFHRASRNECVCGNCPACLRQIERREKRAALVGCRCGWHDCDCARWDATFERNHGSAERAYYGESTIRTSGSTLGGAVGRDLRGVKVSAGVAAFPDRDQWRAVLHAEAAAGRERRDSSAR